MSRRCEHCGFSFNADDATVCSVCGATLGSGQSMSGQAISVETNQNRGVSFSRGEARISSYPRRQNTSTYTSTRRERQEISHGEGILRGRINQLERYDERPRADLYSIFSKIMIWILILIPFLCLFFVTGIMSLVFAILGLRTLAHLFNPIIWATSLFEFFEIMVLARIRGTDQVPIYRGSVEDSNGQETLFFFRGPLNYGHLVQGNHVEFRGQNRRGTFVVRQGRDLTTNAVITSSYRNPWRVIFCILVCLYMILISMFFIFAWQQI